MRPRQTFDYAEPEVEPLGRWMLRRLVLYVVCLVVIFLAMGAVIRLLFEYGGLAQK
jgi:hypothetical protein